MKPMYKQYVLLCSLITVVLVAGCFSLEPRTNPTAYYVLGGDWDEANRRGLDTAGVSVGLRQVRLAAYLETPRMVVRRGTHTIEYAEYDRWGEDLNRGINRTVAGYLATRPGVQRVDVVPWPRWASHEYAVQLRVLRFEGVADAPAQPQDGGGAAAGEVHLLVTWEIVATEDGAVVARGTTDYREGGWEAGDYDELAAMLDAALEALAADLGDRLAQLP